ncbi:Aerobactin synthase [Enhygromyxa salina]|uniref:Aerobactin synthase n=1 Tax=Enhygromyxa salina TaxID=215803 RepID=A0A2S9XIV2_9BACT|nr:IucA/IucC family protein [Enhygromyxa salina]PRP92611.1 Aerobactin synthase [Enhygromyxa salina]
MIGASDDWREAWRLANARRLAQAIGELSFEGLLAPERLDDDRFRLSLGDAIEYRFHARASAWGGVHVEREGIERRVGASEFSPVDSPLQLLFDAREQLGATPELLSEWFTEIHNGLLAEAQQCEALRERDAAALAELDGVSLERCLDGHPKLIAHRGRIGWGVDALRAYAPEFEGELRLQWLVVDPELARSSGAAARGRELVSESCDEREQARLLERLATRAPALAGPGVLVPVHPWQWQHHVAAHYGRWLGSGAIVALGSFGDRYAPRLSLRTLANLDRPERADLKLALTILNTSCWRGLPGRDIARGSGIAVALRALVAADPNLAKVRILGDLGGVHVPHPDFEALDTAPYRVRELLGAIWRTSARSQLARDEAEIPAAALHQRDLAGTPLLRVWVERSGLSLSAWLSALFEHTAVPLYHLLCAHGLGVIAHGQNLGLIFVQNRPTGIVLRDFHGDLRRRESVRFAPGSALDQLTGLPDEHVLHDLYTGYFVSVLRFVAPLLERSFGLAEAEFLALLRRSLRRYQDAHPELHEAFERLDLLQPTMARICLNRARLRVNHGGGALRPLPVLGPPLQNPLSGQ